MMRTTLNFGLNIETDMFAYYRIPPPYKAVTRHPKNATMGGGKGKIDHYVTPVRPR